MKKIWTLVEELLPFAGSLATVILGFVIMIVTKAAMSEGMSRYIIVLYATALQALLFLPPFIFHRKNRPPSNCAYLVWLAAWCIQKKGLVFVAMFGLGPLGIPINALMSAIFLGHTLHVGSVVGAIIIVTGFYGVMWVQSKEKYGQDQVTEADGPPQASSHAQTPLLESHA